MRHASLARPVDGLPGRKGTDLAVDWRRAMWLMPISFVLRITKTRRGWQVYLRVNVVI